MAAVMASSLVHVATGTTLHCQVARSRSDLNVSVTGPSSCRVSSSAISSRPIANLNGRAFVSGGILPAAFILGRTHKFSDSSVRRFKPPRADAGTDSKTEKTPFGYTRKDVILIGVGILAFGVALKSGLEFAGLDSLQAGNVVQIVMVLGLMVGWTITYVFRVGNKEMTYVKQLKDYEDAVMQKRLEELPEAELEAMLAEIEEEKLRIKERREKKKAQKG